MLYARNGSSFASTTMSMRMPRQRTDASALITDDLSGDGVPDLAVATTNSGGGLTTMISVEDGTFRSPSYQYTHEWTSLSFLSLATGDFDGDGDLDLAEGAHGRLTIASPVSRRRFCSLRFRPRSHPVSRQRSSSTFPASPRARRHRSAR